MAGFPVCPKCDGFLCFSRDRDWDHKRCEPGSPDDRAVATDEEIAALTRGLASQSSFPSSIGTSQYVADNESMASAPTGKMQAPLTSEKERKKKEKQSGWSIGQAAAAIGNISVLEPPRTVSGSSASIEPMQERHYGHIIDHYVNNPGRESAPGPHRTSTSSADTVLRRPRTGPRLVGIGLSELAARNRSPVGRRPENRPQTDTRLDERSMRVLDQEFDLRSDSVEQQRRKSRATLKSSSPGSSDGRAAQRRLEELEDRQEEIDILYYELVFRGQPEASTSRQAQAQSVQEQRRQAIFDRVVAEQAMLEAAIAAANETDFAAQAGRPLTQDALRLQANRDALQLQANAILTTTQSGSQQVSSSGGNPGRGSKADGKKPQRKT